jgi:methylphosphotriester-DNA--protein-cysteine methyltransferase
MSIDRTKQRRLESPTSLDPRWAAVVARAPRADGTFYYSVETTGVYSLAETPHNERVRDDGRAVRG